MLSLLGLSLGPLPSLSLPPLAFPSLQFHWDLPRIVCDSISGVAPAEIVEKLQPFFQTMVLEVDALIQSTQTRADQFIEFTESIGSNISTFFSDYAPPVLNTTTLLAEFHANQEEFAALTWNLITNLTLESTEEESETTSFIPIIKDTLYSFFSTWTPKAFVGLSISIPEFITKWNAVVQWAVLLDISYRCITLIKVTTLLRSS